MSEKAAAAADFRFFSTFPRRRYRIRKPIGGEFENEFLTLGEHADHRRRIIVARVDRRREQYFLMPFARIPYLLLADESVEDNDEVAGAIFRRILADAAKLEGKEIVF